MIASGSSDGHVHIWKCGEFNKSLEHAFSIPVNGFVNSLSFTGDGNYLLGAIGQEHRLGRWWKDSTVKNGIIIITLNKII
jgi:ribosomal RNA-processing protein 9